MTVAETTPGYATPIPEQPLSSSSPAWDPSSRTPIQEPKCDPDAATMYDDDRSPRASSSSALARPGPASLQQNVEHPLLNPRLLGINLKVVVSGGKGKDKDKDKELPLVVSLTSREGQLHIRRKYYKGFESFSPESVSPKRLSPMRDNGLLVVIEGKHCGKYVHWIHHAYKNGNAVVLLAVVMRTADAAESLTEERLQLDPGSLCIGSETKAERERGDHLMRALREEARKMPRTK